MNAFISYCGDRLPTKPFQELSFDNLFGIHRADKNHLWRSFQNLLHSKSRIHLFLFSCNIFATCQTDEVVCKAPFSHGHDGCFSDLEKNLGRGRFWVSSNDSSLSSFHSLDNLDRPLFLDSQPDQDDQCFGEYH